MKRKIKSIKKDYYALYLPIEDEQIQVGDHFSSPKNGTNMYPADRIESGIIYTKNPHGQKKFDIEKEGLKKSKLFLCTKNIMEGKAFDKSAGWCNIVRIFDTVANVHYDDCKLSRPHSSLISVIDEISPKAVWIKHGDKLSLDDIDIPLLKSNQVKMICPTCKSYH